MLFPTPNALMMTHSTDYWEKGENNKLEGQHMAVGVKTVTIVACQFSLEKGLDWIRDIEHKDLGNTSLEDGLIRRPGKLEKLIA